MVARVALRDDRTLSCSSSPGTINLRRPTLDLAAKGRCCARSSSPTVGNAAGFSSGSIARRTSISIVSPRSKCRLVARPRRAHRRRGVLRVADGRPGLALSIAAAYVLAGELAKAGERHDEAFASYEALLRPFIEGKQKGAERFSAAFAPKTRLGLFVRNQVIKPAPFRDWRDLL